MGGLRGELPATFWTFLVASLALAGFPLVTAGFYSKDLILSQAFFSGTRGAVWLWGAGLVGAFLTAIYIFRAVFEVFFGDDVEISGRYPGAVMTLPMIALALLSVVGGFVETPPALGGVHLFSGLLTWTVPAVEQAHHAGMQAALVEWSAAIVPLVGIVLAWWLFLRSPRRAARLRRSPLSGALYRLWDSGWGFDRAYHGLFVEPYNWIARVNREDFVDRLYAGVAEAARAVHAGLSRSQTGRLRWYGTVLAAGVAALLAYSLLFF